MSSSEKNKNKRRGKSQNAATKSNLLDQGGRGTL
jgi:hypothetical protein